MYLYLNQMPKTVPIDATFDDFAEQLNAMGGVGGVEIRRPVFGGLSNSGGAVGILGVSREGDPFLEAGSEGSLIWV